VAYALSDSPWTTLNATDNQSALLAIARLLVFSLVQAWSVPRCKDAGHCDCRDIACEEADSDSVQV